MALRQVTVGLVVALTTLGSTTITSAPSSARGAAAPAAAAATPTLVSVHARHKGAVDRVVLSFVDGLPTDVDLAWSDTLVHDGSGLPVRVAGAKVLSVVIHGAVAHDQGGPTAKGRTAFALPNVIEAVQAGDFEATVTVGLGVQKQTSFQVRTRSGPDRVVVDVGAAFATTSRSVWLLDEDAFATGQQPYVVPVPRSLPAATPAAAALSSLFAGPTPVEKADGLRLVRSRAWGFADLRIADGIARLRLTRACSSGGSTFTVADQIVPTLKQFPSVDWVKIYGPGGRTERPDGQVDSIPTCLEP